PPMAEPVAPALIVRAVGSSTDSGDAISKSLVISQSKLREMIPHLLSIKRGSIEEHQGNSKMQ
ncbi:hypothetical protein NL529_28725, partial [Klebsiella pneumoniae]|nr:hypothetical protein [Klebsiella pneumoniae]